MTFDEIRSDFLLLDDWEDRYRYLIELGRALPALDEALKTDANKVRGCASQVWLATTPNRDGTLHLAGVSDALIVQGLIAILFAIYQGKSRPEILAIDAQALFAEIGLQDHLTPQRSNGLAAMVARIRDDAMAILPA
jgi:cysteine desulfuration protein SufE